MVGPPPPVEAMSAPAPISASLADDPSPAPGDVGDLRAVARGSSINLVGAAVSTLTNFALIVVVTHQLPRRDAGVFFAATSLFLLGATAAGLGTSTATVYFLPRLSSARDTTAIRRLLKIAAVPVITASVVAMGVLFALPRSLGQATRVDGVHHGVDLLWALAFALPFATLADLFQSGTRGFGQMTTTVLVEKIGRPLVQLVGVTAAALTGNLLLLAVAWALPYLPAALLSLLAVRRLQERLAPPNQAAPSIDRLGRAYWQYSLPRALSGVASLALQRLDIVLVAGFRGPTAAALYTAATRFLVVGQFLAQSILLALQPRISALLGRGSQAEAQTLYRATTAWLVLLTWPLYLVMALYPHVFLSLFGHGYGSAESVVVILSLSMLLATVVGQVDVMLAMGGRSWYNLANVLLALAVNIGLNVLLIPRYGIAGAAIAWAAAIAAGNLIALLEVYAILRIHPFGGATLAAATASTVCFAAPALSRLGHGGWPVNAGCLLAGGLVYLLWLRRSRDRLQLAVLTGVVTGMLRRRRTSPGSSSRTPRR